MQKATGASRGLAAFPALAWNKGRARVLLQGLEAGVVASEDLH